MLTALLTLLHPYMLYEADGAGAGGGGGEATPGNALKEVRESIGKSASEVGSPKDNRPPSERHLGYFDDDDTGGDPDPGAGEGGEPPATPDPGSQQKVETGDDARRPFDPTENLDDDPGAGEGEGKGQQADPGQQQAAQETQEKKDYFYVPGRDAEGEGDNVYPNEYQDRQSAEYAIAAKIDKLDQMVAQIKELGGSVDGVIPAGVAAQIEKLRDVTVLGGMEDGEVRSSIVNLDKSLKAYSASHERVEKETQTVQQDTKLTEQLSKAENEAADASNLLGLPDRINREKPGTFDRVLAIVDEQIENALSPLEKAVADHEADDSFIEEHGREKYISKLRDLEKARDQKRTELAAAKDKIIAYNDALVESRAAKKQTAQPTQAERLKQMDDTFLSWQKNRSAGPFALDIFKAPTTDPIVHLRKFAFAPSNVNKWDLTTDAGWDQAYEAWKADNAKRFAQQNPPKKPAGQQQAQRRQSQYNDPIPEPDPSRPVIKEGKHTEIGRVKDDIRRTAREMFR